MLQRWPCAARGVVCFRYVAYKELMKWIDIPPVWTVLFLVIAWWIARLQPDWLRLELHFLHIALLGAGLALMIAAVLEMRRRRTTVIPHMEASHLVTTGVFGMSRNPIYLADTFFVAGFALLWGAPVALILVPIFMRIITQRFILPEEAGLQAKFPEEFARYAETTRRWI